MQKRIGDRLIIIGVAHVLPKSISEVREAIELERPNIVAVELCPSRYSALGQRAKVSAIDALREGQLNLFILNRLLYHLQNKFARQTGIFAGEEMLVAIRSAEKVGARVELIDRDIGLTLERFNSHVGKLEKLKLLSEIFMAFLPMRGKISLEKLMNENAVPEVVREFKRIYPKAYDVFIEERDEFMASRIASLLKISNGKIVCVVGAGHLPGIYQKLLNLGNSGHAN
jgi:pheromone shutdown-related protein TraB